MFGRAERTPGDRFGFWYFHPTWVPRDLPLDLATVDALSEADAALGQLQGLGRLVRDPELLLGPYLTREALASSRIEGTEASLSEVLQDELGGSALSKDEGVAEVRRYVAATRRGLELIKTLPISRRLACELHQVLLNSVRGAEKLPGEFRVSPVWIGSTTDNPETATFVPPVPVLIPELFSDWERFVNESSRRPLITAALMHYQFETIHPFLDGNGRIGRLLIGLFLVESGRLPMPLLYLSGYLERNRREYYDRLQAVRERGEVQEWLQFFLTAVRRQAEDASARATSLVDLRESYLAEAHKTRTKLPGLVDLIFRNPYITVARAERLLHPLSNQGARNLIRDAERRGWLTNVGSHGRGGRNYWVAHRVYDVIEAPVNY